MTVSDELLEAVKQELSSTHSDTARDARFEGYIMRGVARLQQIAGGPLDFSEGSPNRQLLYDYCRYANSGALEVFETNYQSALLELNLVHQAENAEEEAADDED